MWVFVHPDSPRKIERARLSLEVEPSLDSIKIAYQLLAEIIAAEVDVDPTTLLTAEEITHMRQGNPILAIKAVRNRIGFGLREAKDLVESAGDKLGLRVLTPDGYRWPRPRE